MSPQERPRSSPSIVTWGKASASVRNNDRYVYGRPLGVTADGVVVLTDGEEQTEKRGYPHYTHKQNDFPNEVSAP